MLKLWKSKFIKLFFFAMILSLFLIWSYPKIIKSDNTKKIKLIKKEQIEKTKEVSIMMAKAQKVLNKEITDKETIKEIVEYFKDEKMIEFLKEQGVYHAIERTINYIDKEYLMELSNEKE